ncbi:carboxypeptidase regulatory-like domain-containing protein [Leptospira kemamanensis]|uniref:Carboxypeptidase regulatory-like domain-containing protein n=1 Tax=Leptospira kemamanensis TaxID=2484942 RepID=A0A4R9JN76_9LEPT|nr:carboxypeptidase-like regulatory domain-containing protein [Leptospira kemamanensis]TGL51408.1 carboxypeptidase regulatory-like domain-containing protein [Leptospira kemamanensis]
MKRAPIFFLLVCLVFFSNNCYYNPILQKYVFAEPTEENSLFPGLSLLGLTQQAPFALSLTGQIRNQDGSTVPSAELTVISRSNELDGLDTTVTTDDAGRFFIRLASGTTTFAVKNDGSLYFTFTLSVTSPVDIRVTEIKDDYEAVEVSSFFVYEEGNQPSFFELTYSEPFHNRSEPTSPNNFYFEFSEEPQFPENGQEATWLSQNISISPSLTMSDYSSEGSSFSFNVSGYTSQTTTYTINLGPGILGSVTGLPLTPRTIIFTCISPCSIQ